MSSFRRGGVWCAAYGCSSAYNKRKTGVGFFFGFRSSRCGKSRSRVLVDLALVSCSLLDQYVQHSVKRGYSVDYGHLNSLDLARESKTF